MSKEIQKAIFIPAKVKILFSGSPERNGFNKLFATYPISFGQYSHCTYEYWIGFLLEYLKDKGYDIIIYDLEQDERVLKFVKFLEERQIVKTPHATIKKADDLRNIIIKNLYNSNDSTFVSDDLELMKQCEKMFPENKFPGNTFSDLINDQEKGKSLIYRLWHESKSSIVAWNTVTSQTSFYKYNASNDLSILLPDLIHFT
jgi:hypothetical protein